MRFGINDDDMNAGHSLLVYSVQEVFRNEITWVVGWFPLLCGGTTPQQVISFAEIPLNRAGCLNRLLNRVIAQPIGGTVGDNAHHIDPIQG